MFQGAAAQTEIRAMALLEAWAATAPLVHAGIVRSPDNLGGFEYICRAKVENYLNSVSKCHCVYKQWLEWIIIMQK